MFLLDVNVVVAVFRDDHPDHDQARQWFDRMVGGDEAFTVPMLVWSGFFRVVTNPRIFEAPAGREEAFDFAEAVCAQVGYLHVEPGSRHISLLRRVCEEGDAAGDLIPDATVAAIALERGCTVVSFDRDFARFDSVAHLRPGD